MSRCQHHMKLSKFICLSCGKVILDGVNRGRHRKEWLHIKDLFCPFEGKEVKSVEVRWCDQINEVEEQIPKLKERYGY